MTQADVTSRYFQRQPSPRRGPVRLGAPWVARSRHSCAKSCMTKYENCTSFLFNSATGLCTPGAYINEKQPLPSSAEGDFFQSFYCDTSKGFSVRTFGNTVACAAAFGPATYQHADEDCQSKGAYLMPVRTAEKYYLLIYNLTGNRDTWVGCDDIQQEGTFIWKEDGRRLTAAEKSAVFGAGEPNDHLGAEDCMTYHSDWLGLWDYNCSYEHFYACEMPYRR
ncbi:hypothetical protein BsWGS_24598 [Bradybaena similaris]